MSQDKLAPSPFQPRDSFMSLCRKMNIDTETEEKARRLLQTFEEKAKDKKYSDNEIWDICALYMVSSGVVPASSKSGISLSQLLLHMNMKIVEFFDPLETFVSLLFSDDKVLREEGLTRLSILKNQYLNNTFLFKKYKELFETYFKDALPMSPNKGFSSAKKRRAADTTSVFQFGWILFLITRVRILNTNPPDYVKSMYLLYSVFDFLLYHAPDQACKSIVFEISNRPGTASDFKAPFKDSIQAICGEHYMAAPVKQFQEDLFYPFVINLTKKRILASASNTMPYNKLYLSGLMVQHFDHNLRSVEKEYKLILLNGGGDIDETMFLTNHTQIQPTSSSSSEGQWKWLIELMEKVKESPVSTELTRHFQNCLKGNPMERIEGLIATLMEEIQFASENVERRAQIKGVYYYLLESIINFESKRLNTSDFSALLSNIKFLSSLMIPTTEIVVSCNALSDVQYPFFLEKLKIPAYDVCIIIESIVKSSCLPESLRNHLVTIEEKTLESLIWRSDSPLNENIVKEKDELFDRLKQSGTPAKPLLKASQIFGSPKFKPSNMAVDLLLKKVSFVASLRINKLCNEITQMKDHSVSIANQVEYVFLYIATQTNLLVDRHIDQIILCSIYVMCKINDIHPPLMFSELIAKYRMLPQANKTVYANVKMEGSESDNIIAFYNKIFVPALEDYLKEIKESQPEDIKNRPSDSLFSQQLPGASLYQLSPYKQVGQRLSNVVITPMRKKTPLLMKAISKGNPVPGNTVYSIGKSPSKQLRDINTHVNTDSVARKLSFD